MQNTPGSNGNAIEPVRGESWQGSRRTQSSMAGTTAISEWYGHFRSARFALSRSWGWNGSLRELRGEEDGGLVPEFRGGLEVNVHGVNGGRRLDPGGFLRALEQGYLGAGALGQRGFDLRTDNQVGQAPGGFGVRSGFEHGQGVGDEERAKLAGLAVRVDDRHGAAGLDLARGVVGIGQAERNLP